MSSEHDRCTYPPDDIAEVVRLLVSDREKWMTGTDILVDGGMTAH